MLKQLEHILEKQLVALEIKEEIAQKNNATEYTKVTLNTDEILFAAYKADTFEKNYKEDYLTLFIKSSTDNQQIIKIIAEIFF